MTKLLAVYIVQAAFWPMTIPALLITHAADTLVSNNGSLLVSSFDKRPL